MALQLSTQAFGPLGLAAAPPGGAPSHIEFSITSSGGPFCIVGFYIDASVPGTPPAGKVEIELSRINGNGSFTRSLNSQTARPYDPRISWSATDQ